MQPENKIKSLFLFKMHLSKHSSPSLIKCTSIINDFFWSGGVGRKGKVRIGGHTLK